MLKARPWSETSLLVDVFTQEFGRFRLLAKGARRQKTGSRALLQAFQPLLISWVGKSGLPTLTHIELRAYSPRLKGQRLASAFYMSELIFKFLHAHDAHENLFMAYEHALNKLKEDNEPEAVLREFECSLLGEIGYGLQLAHEANHHQPVEADQRYFYYPEKGPILIREKDTQKQAANLNVSGETLLALAQHRYENEQVQKESKRLLRTLLLRQIKGEFNTRKVYAQMLKTQDIHE